MELDNNLHTDEVSKEIELFYPFKEIFTQSYLTHYVCIYKLLYTCNTTEYL